MLIRGQKPLKAYKILPDEISAFSEIEYTRISDYIPQWRNEEKIKADIEAEKIKLSEQSKVGVQFDEYEVPPKPNFGTKDSKPKSQKNIKPKKEKCNEADRRSKQH